MPTTVTRYINSNSTVGGDGTTNATTGANRAYASETEWDTAEVTNLVTADELHKVYVTGLIDAKWSIGTGWVSDATRYVHVIGDWEGPKYDATKSLIQVSNDDAVYLRANKVIFEKIQIEVTSPGADGCDLVTFGFVSSGLEDYRFYKCLFMGHASGSYNQFGITVNDNSKEIFLKNCLFYNFGTLAATACINLQNIENCYVHNCSFIEGKEGINFDAGNLQVINSLFDTDIATDINGGTDSFTYCAFSDSGPIGAGTGCRISQTFTYQDSGNGDYRLATTDAGARNYGTDLSGNATLPVSDDILGTARPQATYYDIGCFETIESVSSSASESSSASVSASASASASSVSSSTSNSESSSFSSTSQSPGKLDTLRIDDANGAAYYVFTIEEVKQVRIIGGKWEDVKRNVQTLKHKIYEPLYDKKRIEVDFDCLNGLTRQKLRAITNIIKSNGQPDELTLYPSYHYFPGTTYAVKLDRKDYKEPTRAGLPMTTEMTLIFHEVP